MIYPIPDSKSFRPKLFNHIHLTAETRDVYCSIQFAVQIEIDSSQAGLKMAQANFSSESPATDELEINLSVPCPLPIPPTPDQIQDLDPIAGCGR